MLSFACTRSNPYFHVLPEDGSTSGESTSDEATAEPPGGTSTTSMSGGSQETTQSVDPDGSGGSSSGTSGPPIDETTDTTDTSSSPDPSDATTTTGDESTTTTTGDESTTGGGPCVGVCGTPGCGTCPGVAMIPFDGFKIDALETTNADYAEFLAAEVPTAIQGPSCGWNAGYTPTMAWPPPAEKAQFPVVFVDWCDARAYCEWAGKRLCGKIDGEATGFDWLSTIAPNNMWYRACSGGVGNDFAYGDDYAPQACNTKETPFDAPIAVGSMPLCEGSAPGLFDMTGNVFEWVDSCASGADDAECQRRGGSYFSEGINMQCNLLSSRPRTLPEGYVGIRCCADE
jgi:sulfatase modifying factor 1